MDIVTILLFILLFGLSAFFSGSEIAFMSLPPHKVNSLLKKRRYGAKDLKYLKENNDRLLILILVGNNLVNVLTASFATKISIDIANSMGSSQSLAIGISTGIITLLLLLFGEIFPKTLATRYAEQIALFTSKIYIFLGYVLYPIIVAIEFLMRILNTKKDLNQISDEEIESFIELSYSEGSLGQGEYEKIKKLLDFYEITTEEIMTPRIKIDALSNQLTVEEAIADMLEFSHSRIPIYQDNIDNIYSVVMLRDLIKFQKEGKGTTKLSSLNLSSIIKVPLTQVIHKVLDIFKKQRQHIAVAIDEYGGVAGLISLEDIIEEVFGEIKDESDQGKDEFIGDKKGGYLIQAHVRIDELLERFDLEFRDVQIKEEDFAGESISYFITSHLQRLAKQGEVIKLVIYSDKDKKTKKFLEIKILKIENSTVTEVKANIFDR